MQWVNKVITYEKITYSETQRIMAYFDLLRTVKVREKVAKLIERWLNDKEFLKVLKSRTFYKENTPIFDYHTTTSNL